MNTRYVNHDEMGASINFDQPFAIGVIFLLIGIGIQGWLAWYFCILAFVILELVSTLYKWWILDKIMNLFRKPNPTKRKTEQGAAANP